MQDAESKVALLAYYIEWVARIARAIPDDYLARVYGRSLFIGVDSFLAISPRLKNELRDQGRLSADQSREVTDKINKLRSDYESYYSTIRDKVAAHQQEVDLGLLLEAWNEIDEATLVILCSDVLAVWADLRAHGSGTAIIRPSELDDPSTLIPFGLLTPPEGMRVGVDRVSMTRANTVSMVPIGIFQEKAVRVLTAFEGVRTILNSGLERVTARWFLPEKASVDLLVVDACSLIDNLFEDRPPSTGVAGEDSLVKIWKTHKVTGTPILERFPRDASLEQDLRELRNKFCAHVDPDVPLKELERRLRAFPLQSLDDYVGSILQAFRQACAQDLRTRPFLLHGERLRGFDSIDTPAAKPFR
jgi:hypothetical protein